MTARGSTADQVALLFMLARYERAERLVAWFPHLLDLAKEADRRHEALLLAALNCGFEPGRKDGHLSTLQWSRKRAELIRQMLPNNVSEAQRRAA